MPSRKKIDIQKVLAEHGVGLKAVNSHTGDTLAQEQASASKQRGSVFEAVVDLPSLERFSELGLQLTLGSRGSGITGMASFAAPESVITSLAGFGLHRPQPLGGRTAVPAAFRYVLTVSRRIPVACWMRRSDPQPSQS